MWHDAAEAFAVNSRLADAEVGVGDIVVDAIWLGFCSSGAL